MEIFLPNCKQLHTRATFLVIALLRESHSLFECETQVPKYAVKI